jgi:hypothetical protein
MNHVLQAVEEQMALNAFFHASDKPLQVGKTIVSRGSGGWTPAVVNAARPKNTPPRTRHLFMTKDPKCVASEALGQDFSQYVYKVTPKRKVIKANWAHLDQVLECSSKRASKTARCAPAKVKAAAKAYWKGKPVRGKKCHDEYLTMSFRVDKLVRSPPKSRHTKAKRTK